MSELSKGRVHSVERCPSYLILCLFSAAFSLQLLCPATLGHYALMAVVCLSVCPVPDMTTITRCVNHDGFISKTTTCQSRRLQAVQSVELLRQMATELRLTFDNVFNN